MRTYPLFLLLEEKKALVVGGGEVAARKVESLIEAGAIVKVVTKEANEEIKGFADSGLCELEVRPYEEGEAAGYVITIAATNDMETNKAVAFDAESKGRLVNIVDQPELCNFIVPSVIKRGQLVLAVSTGGAAPSLSKRLREILEKVFPESMGALAELLGAFRAKILDTVPDIEERKKIMTQVVNSPEFEKFLGGDEAPLKELLSKWI